jgi:hypothetical protein
MNDETVAKLPWVVEYQKDEKWVVLEKYEHQFQGKTHVKAYEDMYRDNLLSSSELLAAGPMKLMRCIYREPE